MKSESLTRLKDYSRLDCGRAQMVRHQHIPHAGSPPVRSPRCKDPISGLPIQSGLLPLSEELSQYRSHRNGRPGLLGLQSLRHFSVDPCPAHVNALTGVVNVPLLDGQTLDVQSELVSPMRDKVIVDDVLVAVLRGRGELAESITVQVKLRNVPKPQIIVIPGLVNLLDSF